MIYRETVRKLNEMKLYGMAKSFEEKIILPDHKDLSFEEFFSILVDDENMHRKNKTLTRLLKDARFKIPSACLEDIDYKHQRGRKTK